MYCVECVVYGGHITSFVKLTHLDFEFDETEIAISLGRLRLLSPMGDCDLQFPVIFMYPSNW
jgi:hypothetical protein